MNESNYKKIKIINENAKIIKQNMFLENENGNLKESISRFDKGKEILDGMISMTSTHLKSKNGIDFKNAHASSSNIVNPSNPITKIYQGLVLELIDQKGLMGIRLTILELIAQEDQSLGNTIMLILMVFIILKWKSMHKILDAIIVVWWGTKILVVILERLIWVTQMMNLTMLTPKDPSIFGYLKCDEVFSCRCAWNPQCAKKSGT